MATRRAGDTVSVIVAVAIAVGLLTVACHQTTAERGGVMNEAVAAASLEPAAWE